MYLYTFLSVFITISSSTGSLPEKFNVRVRRQTSAFIMTTCLLISSAAKQRCDTNSKPDFFGDGTTQKESCVTDEKFRVRYETQNGQMITSFIETSGQQFPRLMEVNISLDFH